MKDYSYFVFETPQDCFSCPFLICKSEHYCEIEDGGRLIEVNVCDGKPDWCPLRQLPEPRNLTKPENYNPWVDENAFGFNECLQEILEGLE